MHELLFMLRCMVEAPNQEHCKEEWKPMKRFMSIALALLLLVALVPATAASGTIKVAENRSFRFKSPDAEADVFTIENISKKDLEVTVTVYDQSAHRYVQTMTFSILQGDAPVAVKAYVYDKLRWNGDMNTYMYTIKVKGGETRQLQYAQKLTIRKDKNNVETRIYDQAYGNYLPRNTVSSFGPHFRDVTPRLTDLWYMFTPIDLSIQGRQTFVLVASNMFEVGEAYVDVNQDTVTVSYYMFDQEKPDFSTELISEFVTFYNSYADVDIVEPENMPGPSAFAFNQPFSIQNQLGGDTNVLMFIRNRITYYRFPTPRSEYIRFWENKPEYIARREAMLNMMDPIMAVESNK